jgi:hypothetical protein
MKKEDIRKRGEEVKRATTKVGGTAIQQFPDK